MSMSDIPPATDPAPKPRTPMHALLKVGIAVMVLSLVWWLTYYSAYGGWFGVLDVKYLCLSGWMEDCDRIQAQIGSGPIPAYSPFVWWAGTILLLVGLYLTMRNRRR